MLTNNIPNARNVSTSYISAEIFHELTKSLAVEQHTIEIVQSLTMCPDEGSPKKKNLDDDDDDDGTIKGKHQRKKRKQSSISSSSSGVRTAKDDGSADSYEKRLKYVQK